MTRAEKVAPVQNWLLDQAAPEYNLVWRLMDEVMPSSQQACVLGGLLWSVSYNKDPMSYFPQFHCHCTVTGVIWQTSPVHCSAVCKHKDVPYEIPDQALNDRVMNMFECSKAAGRSSQGGTATQQGNDIEWYWMIGVSQNMGWFVISIQDQVYPEQAYFQVQSVTSYR